MGCSGKVERWASKPFIFFHFMLVFLFKVESNPPKNGVEAILEGVLCFFL